MSSYLIVRSKPKSYVMINVFSGIIYLSRNNSVSFMRGTFSEYWFQNQANRREYLCKDVYSSIHLIQLIRNVSYSKGRVRLPNQMNFRKSAKGGRGVVILNPKNYVADFGNFKQVFLSMKLIQKSNFRVQGMFFQQLY